MVVAPLETPIFGPIPPFSRHAITIHLPTWAMILRFMERDMSLMKQFKTFYPRIMLNADVKALVAKLIEKSGLGEGFNGLPFPSRETAEECVRFAISEARAENVCTPEEISIRLFTINKFHLWTVFFPMPKNPGVIPFWQNAGMGISSRLSVDAMAEIDALEEVPLSSVSDEVMRKSDGASQGILRTRIAALLNRAPAGRPRAKEVGSDDVSLFQTGMSSIYSVHQYFLKEYGQKTVLFGFAFHATPHVFEDFGPGMKQYSGGDAADLEALEKYLIEEEKEGRKIQALWTEVPSNPLLATPDLAKLRELADRFDFILLVDDTVGSFCNIDVMGFADVVVTSLTKSFSGYADVMAASAVLNPNSKRYDELKKLMGKHYQNVFYDGDADTLAKNNEDYMERSKILNNNAEKLVEFLDGLAKAPNSSVVKAWYPTTSDTLETYKQYMRQKTEDFSPGYGCLFSLELKTEEATAAFYDNFHVHQGPHLGAHLTLAMPYVKGLYGKELEKVTPYGLNEKQIRVSVGLEDTETLIEVFKHALKFADTAKVGEAVTVT